MSQKALKTNIKRTSSPRPEPFPFSRSEATVEDIVAHVVSFAREARTEEIGHETTHVSPNFKRILQISGRSLLASDLVALIAAFTCGGLIAWTADIYVF